MSNATAIRNLAQDMARAQKERTGRIQELAKETADLLQGFDKAHAEISARLRAELSEVRPQLGRAEDERNKESQMEAKARAERVAELAKETADLLQGFDKAHAEMSAQLRSELAGAEDQRNKESQMEAKARAERVAELAKETADLLQGFDKAHAEMSARLRAELSEVRPQLGRAEDERNKESRVEAKARAEEVSDIRSQARELVEGFRRDSAKTAAAWKELVGTMHGRRSATAAPPPVGLPMQVEEEAPPAVEVEQEVAVEEKRGLKETIMAMVQERPGGMKLAEIAEATGEARIKIGNITRMMVNEDKIIKEGLFYYPVEPSTE